MEKIDRAPLSFEHLISWTRENPYSALYRDFWAGAPVTQLPIFPHDGFASVPLRAREYKKKKGFVTILREGGHPYLWKWALEDLTGDYLHRGKRPLTLFSDAHDGIEKPMTLLHRNILPLNGSLANASVTSFAASQYA